MCAAQPLAGHTCDEIAHEVGLANRGTAWRAVDEALTGCGTTLWVTTGEGSGVIHREDDLGGVGGGRFALGVRRQSGDNALIAAAG